MGERDGRFTSVTILFEVDLDLSKSPGWGKQPPSELAHSIAEDWVEEFGEALMERPVTESVGSTIANPSPAALPGGVGPDGRPHLGSATGANKEGE